MRPGLDDLPQSGRLDVLCIRPIHHVHEYEALFRLLALQSYYNAFAGIALPNDASVALHESLGYRAIARYQNVGYKAGAWHDTVWLQRALRPLEVPPQEPRPLRLLAAAEIEAALAPG